MKKLIQLLMAASLCCVAGCDTEIPTDELSDIQSSQNICELQLTASQAKIVGEIVNKASNKNLDDSLKKIDFIFGSHQMTKLYQYAASLYTEDEEDSYCVCGTDVCDKGVGCVLHDGTYTCAGYDKKSVEEGECTPIQIKQRYMGYLIVTRLLPIFKELMIVRDLAKKVVYRQDESNAVMYIWSVIRPLLVNDNVQSYFFKSEKYREKLGKFGYVDGNPRNKSDYNIKPEHAIPEEMNPDNYDIIGTVVVLGAMAECQNGNSGYCPEEKYYRGYDADGQKTDNWFLFKAQGQMQGFEGEYRSEVLKTPVNTESETGVCEFKYKDNGKDKKDYAPCRQIFPENGLVFHINGTNTNTSKTPGVPERIYSGYRQIAARLLKNAGLFNGKTDSKKKKFVDYSIVDLAKLDGSAGAKEDEIAEMIDQFLVDQMYYLLTAKTKLDNLLYEPRIQRLLGLLFEDPLGISVKENVNCAYVPDLNGDYKKKDDGTDGYELAEVAGKGGYAQVCETKITPETISNEDAVTIMTALKNMFSYSYGDYFADDPTIYEAHRRFFSQYMLSSLSSTEQRNLFEMTFTQNNRCVDHETPTGQVVGINQYCSDRYFENNIFSFNDLTSAVFGNDVDKETAVNNSSALADGIIMDNEFELKKGKSANADKNCTDEENAEPLYSLKSEQIQKVAGLLGSDPSNIKSIDIIAGKIYLGDDRGTNPLTVKIKVTNNDGNCPVVHDIVSNGIWISSRCPMGASCTENSECGMCSDSDVLHDYGWFRGDETLESEQNEMSGNTSNIKYDWVRYSNAVCEKGVLVQKKSDADE